MLRISKLADYGTVVMVYLARNPESLSTARDIAMKTHLTLPTVSKLLKKLTIANLLSSTRGVSGGYRLKRSAADITVAEILMALDEEQGLTECSTETHGCALQGVCAITGNWQLISRAVMNALNSISLATLSQPRISHAEEMHIAQLARGVAHG